MQIHPSLKFFFFLADFIIYNCVLDYTQAKSLNIWRDKYYITLYKE